MATKIEYSINILQASPNSNSLTVHWVDDWDYFQKSGLKEKYHQKTRLEEKLQSSMDRMLDKHNLDTIKKTMEMHEDTFKHQIQELHRLYSVQKMLMDELKKEIKHNRLWGPMTSSADHINHSQLINRQHSITQTSSGYNFHLQRLRDNSSCGERSGSCSGDTLRMSRGFDLERPAEEDVSTGVSTIDQDLAGPSSNIALRSNNMNIDGSDEDGEVELTLSIGSSRNKKRSKSYQPHLGCSDLLIHKEKELNSPASFKSDTGGDFSDPSTPMSSSSATFDQERKQPHWLFHGLKLK